MKQTYYTFNEVQLEGKSYLKTSNVKLFENKTLTQQVV